MFNINKTYISKFLTIILTSIGLSLFSTIPLAYFSMASEISHKPHNAEKSQGTHLESAESRNPGNLFPQPKQNKSKSTPPAQTELVEPVFMAKLTGNKVTLKWNAIANSENYHLQVAKDPNFKWLLVDNQTLKATTYEVSELEAGKTYFWRVAAVKNSNDPYYIKGPYNSSSFEIIK